MMNNQFIPTEKYLDLAALSIRPTCNLLVAEGTIRSSKTENFKPIFFYNVMKSRQELHLIAATDLDAIKDNILNGEHGLLEMFPDHLSLQRDEIGGYYVKVKCNIPMFYPKEKKILLAGFSSANKWKKILGKTLGVIFVDEVNTANKQFIDECFARQVSTDNPLQLWTLNGDVPSHWIYTDYINRCKVISKYRNKVPASILADMDNTEKNKGWYYCHFNMQDNPVMDDEKIERASSIYPVGSYYHTIKIKGERGAPGKLLYIDYMDSKKHIELLSTREFSHFGIGMDIGGNRAENSISLLGFRGDYTRVGLIDKYTFKQCGYKDKTEYLISFIKKYQNLNIKYISIDSAESNYIKDIKTQFATLFPNIAVIGSYKATIKDRVDLGIILFSHNQIVFNDTKEGKDGYDAFRIAKKGDTEVREDNNERHNDIIDSIEYALTRHMNALLKAAKKYEGLVA